MYERGAMPGTIAEAQKLVHERLQSLVISIRLAHVMRTLFRERYLKARQYASNEEVDFPESTDRDLDDRVARGSHTRSSFVSDDDDKSFRTSCDAPDSSFVAIGKPGWKTHVALGLAGFADVL